MPSTLLDARQITRRHGGRTVLDAVDLRVDAEARIGLVGPNGAGKSTLLRILAGEEAQDAGELRRFGTVGWLPQLADALDRERSARETILDRVGLRGATTGLERWAAALTAGDLDAVAPHAEALERWLALGGADVEARLGAALAHLGLDAAFAERPLGTLSGGQAARAGLAALAVARFDVVLLDEPTNHLDADGLARLGALLAARPGDVVLVSHDRAVLAETATEIAELDPHSGRLTHYGGGWTRARRSPGSACSRTRPAARRTRCPPASARARS